MPRAEWGRLWAGAGTQLHSFVQQKGSYIILISSHPYYIDIFFSIKNRLTEDHVLAGRRVEGQALLISRFPFHGAFPSLPYPIIVHKNKDIFSFGKIPTASLRLEWGGYCCVQQTSCSKERNCNHGLYSVRFLEERKPSRNSDNKTNAVAVLHILWSILMGTTIHIRHPIQ